MRILHGNSSPPVGFNYGRGFFVHRDGSRALLRNLFKSVTEFDIAVTYLGVSPTFHLRITGVVVPNSSWVILK